MKYQIYLNKEASDTINGMAQEQETKPNTLIKEMMESILAVFKATQEATEKEIKKHEKATN